MARVIEEDALDTGNSLTNDSEDRRAHDNNTWFSPTLTYAGAGKAEFEHPSLVVSGATTVQVREDGTLVVIMDIKDPPSDPLIAFSGADARNNGTSLEYEIADMMGNSCKKLEVTTTDGVFTAQGEIHYGYEMPQITFHCYQGEFKVQESAQAKYWAMPIQNFLTGFTERYAPLDSHPLRLRRPPSNLPEDQSPRREWILSFGRLKSAYPIIAFPFRETVAFIEPMPDYQKREEQLHEKEVVCCITAVMAGETGGREINERALEDWFPYDLLAVLGLGCGTEVGSPWVEFRDEVGNLVVRQHRQLGHPHFTENRGVIDEGLIKDGIRRLIVRALDAPDLKSDHVRVALRLVLRSAWEAASVEDRLAYLSRALEAIPFR